jgi:hypothetical protein
MDSFVFAQKNAVYCIGGQNKDVFRLEAGKFFFKKNAEKIWKRVNV